MAMDAFSASLMKDKREIVIAPTIYKFDTFDAFAEEFQLGERDVVLTNEFIYKPFMEKLGLKSNFVFQEKFGAGEPSEAMIETMYEAIPYDSYDRVIAVGGGAIMDLCKLLGCKRPTSVHELYFKREPVVHEKEVIAIPTTCGTGSEVTNISVAIVKDEKDGVLIYRYGVENQPKPDETPLVYFASDAPAAGFDCDRDEFVGSYRSEEAPIRLEHEHLKNSTLFGGDPCFALELPLTLRAGETKSLNIYLGTEMTESEISKSLAACKAPDFFTASMQKLADSWEDFFSGFQCSLPDKDAETMINIWNPYQMERNFRFSRNISYYATGTFRGIGVRDTAQDVLAMIPLQLDRAKEKFELLLTQQYQDGHCNHYFFPTEGWEPVTRVHSDNHLWLVMDAYHIALEEGSVSYLDTQAPYFDGGSGTIWEHIKQSIRFTAQNMGAHGFPLMLSSDWNDMLYKVCRKGKGESIWTGMQFAVALRMMQELAERMGEPEFAAECKALYDRQQALCRTLAWDGAWFRRCITDEGRFIGSESEPQAKIWLNTQSWAVLSGLGTQEQQRQAMDSVKEYLDTDLGIKKIHPAMTTDYPTKEENLTCYNKGCGENGSVFCHANTWAIIAECMLGRPENAWKYYHQLLPMIAQKTAGAERYKAEPYVYSSNIFGPESDKFGLANVSWLTGTAAWMYLAATQYLLGVRPTWDGLEIDPCLPEQLLPAKVTRVFRGCRYEITITKNQKLLLPHVDGRKQLTVTV